MAWGTYLLALGVVVAGLLVVETAAPSAVLPLVLLLLLSIALAHPTFAAELRGLFKGKG